MLPVEPSTHPFFYDMTVATTVVVNGLSCRHERNMITRTSNGHQTPIDWARHDSASYLAVTFHGSC